MRTLLIALLILFVFATCTLAKKDVPSERLEDTLKVVNLKEEGEAIGKTFADSNAIGSLAKTMEELAPIFGIIGPVLEVFASAFKANQLEEILQAIDALKAQVVGVSAQIDADFEGLEEENAWRTCWGEFRGYMNEVNITQRFFDVYNSNRKNVAARRAFLDQCASNKCGDLALNLLKD